MIRRRALAKLEVDPDEWQTMGVVPPGADRLTLRIKVDGSRLLTISLPERRMRRARALISKVGPEAVNVFLLGGLNGTGILVDPHVRVVVARKTKPAGVGTQPQAAVESR
jgi:hypothetical protein